MMYILGLREKACNSVAAIWQWSFFTEKIIKHDKTIEIKQAGHKTSFCIPKIFSII